MRLGFTGPALCAGALVVLAGCSDSGASLPQAANSNVPTPVRTAERTRAKPSELDLSNPLGRTDEAAMLRSTPDYSITPTGETELSTRHEVSIGSGLGGDPLLGGSSQRLPGEVVEPIDLDLDTNPVPTSLGSESLPPYE